MPQGIERYIVGVSPEVVAQIAAAVRGQGGALGGNNQRSRSEDQKTEGILREGFRRVESAVTRIGTGALATTSALAARGFSGTYESYRLGFEMDRLSRQLAAVMQPFMQAMTYMTRKLADGMAGMSLGSQNRLMGGVLGASVGYALGGPRMALGGGFLGAGLAGGDSVTGGIGGAIIGSRLGPLGAAAGYAIGSVSSSGDYGRLRGEGNSKLASIFGSGVGALTDLGYSVFGPKGLGLSDAPNPMDEIRREADARAGKAPEGKRREAPVPFSAAEEEMGGAARRFQEVIARIAPDGTMSEDAGPLKPIVDALLMIIELLGRIAGVEVSFDTPSTPRT